MKQEDDFEEIAAALRSHKPDPPTPPGLETRIIHALERHQAPAKIVPWPWFLIPPAAAAALAIGFWPASPSDQPIAAVPPPPPPAAIEGPAPAAVSSANPLENEALALTRDARRAGRFLIDCLPSFEARPQ